MRSLGQRPGLPGQLLSLIPHALERATSIGRDSVLAGPRPEMEHWRRRRGVTPQVRVHEHLVVKSEDRAVERRAGEANSGGVGIEQASRVVDRDLAAAHHGIARSLLLASQTDGLAAGIPKADA